MKSHPSFLSKLNSKKKQSLKLDFDNPFVGIWEIDLENKIVSMSEIVLDFMGLDKSPDKIWTLDEVILKFHKDDQKEFMDLNLEELDKQNFTERVWRIKDSNDRYQWVLFRLRSIPGDKSNHHSKLVGASILITKHKKNEVLISHIREISRKILVSEDYQGVFKAIGHTVNDLLETNDTYLATYDEQSNSLDITYLTSAEKSSKIVKVEDSLTYSVIKNKSSMILEEKDILNFFRDKEIKVVGERAKSWIAVPVELHDKTIGALATQNYKKDNAFVDNDLEALKLLAHQLSFIIDIKQIKDNLKSTNMTLNSVLDSMESAIFSTSPDGRQLYLANKSLERIFEIPLEVFHENPLCYVDLITLESQAKIEKYSEELLTNGKCEFAFEIELPSGKRKWINDRSKIITDNEGKPIRIETVFLDITDKKLSEEILKESEEKFRAIAENMPGVIFVYDVLPSGERNHIYAGPGFDTIFGDHHSVNIKSNVENFFHQIHPDDLEKMDIESDSNEDNAPLDIEYRFKKSEDDYIWIRSISSSREIKKNHFRVIGLLFDQTEQKMFENRMLQMQHVDSLGKLAGGIAHEFNNNLGVITGYVSLLAKQETDDDKIELLHAIEKVAFNLKSLTEKLLAYGQSGKKVNANINICKLVDDALEMIESNRKTGIKINKYFSKNLPSFNGDSSQLKLAIYNVLQNSFDAMSNSGILSINISQKHIDNRRVFNFDTLVSSEYIVVEIRDTGIGFDIVNRNKIFEPFYSTKTDSTIKSSGMGLATVYGILKSHESAIEYDSEPQIGTVATIYLKLSENDEVLPIPDVVKPETESEVKDTENIKQVMIVEDEELIRIMVQTMLRRLKIDYIEATTGSKAISLYNKYHSEIDTVILDYNLPDITGKEVLINMKKINPDADILISTGYINEEDTETVLTNGARDILKKPFSYETLIEKLHVKET